MHARCVLAVPIAVVGVYLRLQYRPPIRYLRGKRSEYLPGIFRKPLRAVPVQPAALFLKALRQIPVVQHDKRFYTVLKQCVNGASIEIQPLIVDLPSAVRHHARPRYRDALRIQAKLARYGGVLPVSVIEIAGRISGIVVEYIPRNVGESVPDAFALAVFVPCAFDLIG